MRNVETSKRQNVEPSRQRSARGIVMVLVLGFAALVMFSVTAYLLANSQSMPTALNLKAAVRARYLAGSGVALATHYLAVPPTTVAVGNYWTGVTGFLTDATSDTVDVTVTRSATAQANYSVSSTGTALNPDGTVRGKATITTEIITAPPKTWALTRAITASASISIPNGMQINGNVHDNGNLSCATPVNGAISATGTVSYSGGGLPPITQNAATVTMPTLTTTQWSRYAMNGVVRAATAYSGSGNMSGTTVAAAGGVASRTIVYKSDGTVAFLDSSGSTSLLGTLTQVVTSLTGQSGTQVTAPSVVSANNPGGVLVCNQDIDFQNGTTGLIGTLVVVGNLRVHSSATPNFCAMPGYPCLVVTGDIQLDDNGVTQVYGPVLYGGQFVGNGKPNLTTNGPVLAYGTAFKSDYGNNLTSSLRLLGIATTFTWQSAFQNYYDFTSTTPQPMTLLSWSEQ